jgi:hypothetical protein
VAACEEGDDKSCDDNYGFGHRIHCAISPQVWEFTTMCLGVIGPPFGTWVINRTRGPNDESLAYCHKSLRDFRT